MEWKPIELDLGPLPARKTRRHRLIAYYAAVDTYRTKFLAGRRSTDRLYREFSRGKHDTPSLTTLVKLAPLRVLLEQVEQPGWRERVATMTDPRAPDEAELAQRKLRRKQRQLATPALQRVREIIVNESGSATSHGIAETLGWSIHRVRYYLEILRDADMIQFTDPNPRSKIQSYRALPTPGQSRRQGNAERR